MPLFSKRKPGKQNSKEVKNLASKEGKVIVSCSDSQKIKNEISSPQNINGIISLSESNFLLQHNQRPSNTTAKCVANFPRKSCLSKSLPEILVDNNVLPLFMEFLQRQNAQNILNFWLAAETFCLSCRQKTDYKSRLKTCNKSSETDSNCGKLTAVGCKTLSNIDCQNATQEEQTSSDSIKFTPNYEKNENFPEIFVSNQATEMTDTVNIVYQKDEELQRNILSTQEICQQQSKLGDTFLFDKKSQDNSSLSIMDDAISIYRHFISLDATQPFGVDEEMRRDIESKICNESGQADPDCFKIAQQFAFETLENKYFSDFIRSSYYQKHVMEILTSGKIFLADIMYNDNAVFYFMEFMEQEGKSSLLAFWFAIDSFHQELLSKLDKKQYNMDHALSDAMVLYDKYFSMQATESLGVSDETRIRIENKICREGGPLPDCFEEPMENILTLLEEVYFPIFLESTVYLKYLSEVFNSVCEVEDITTCTDDASSTASGCETVKLLQSLQEDVQEDPDEIWQRPNVGLSIGRVNEFGIYEPGIEPQPGDGQKSGASKLSQKMRKFVSGDSYKVKEEMAWKVAKMVLEDVKRQQGGTNLT